MPSQVGRFIAAARKKQGVGLRELARNVGRSPSFLAMIEKNNPVPGVGEETLRRIAGALELDPDRLITLAGKTPEDVVPSDQLEVAIYRLVKKLPTGRKRRLLTRLERDTL
jgi:transcriptional regulator with XRE-family HTH domain